MKKEYVFIGIGILAFLAVAYFLVQQSAANAQASAAASLETVSVDSESPTPSGAAILSTVENLAISSL